MLNIETKLVNNSIEKLYVVISITNSIKTYVINKGFLISANKWLKNWLPSILSRLLLGGTECQEDHFYSLPFGQAEASIILAQMSFQLAQKAF